jgi:type II secretory pathway predicted ATPase ExeA
MLNEVMEYFGLTKGLRQVGYFETEPHQQLIKGLKAAIQDGELVALSGIVGSGKTTLLWQLQELLKKEREVEVTQSLAVDKQRVNLGTLMLALFADLSTEKDAKLPTQPERRERALVELIRKRDKPIVLFIDDAHDLHNQTLLGLKRLIELVRRRGGRLSVVLAGHPKLKNDLRRPALEEIGSRASVFEFEGIKGHQRRYLNWLLEQCTKPKVKPGDLLSEQAVERLAEYLATPLQIEHYLTLALEQAYRFGEKPVTPELVATVMAPDMEALEPTLARQGYNVRALAELLNTRPAEIRAFLQSRLPPGRTEELKQQLLGTGIPL